ncbi:hypothetical protein J4732_08605 [Serratia marcescens]|uniref:Uncharacterized protein n=1 Tax=Serratia marcescens TaxID=615 RepID=A0A939NQA6_SERMA|nr:hypothetical protein [Serratia marcescens]
MFTFSKPERCYRSAARCFSLRVFQRDLCGQTRVNNLFHLAALLWLAAVFTGRLCGGSCGPIVRRAGAAGWR